jgi:hypothetical protein
MGRFQDMVAWLRQTARDPLPLLAPHAGLLGMLRQREGKPPDGSAEAPRRGAQVAATQLAQLRWEAYRRDPLNVPAPKPRELRRLCALETVATDDAFLALLSRLHPPPNDKMWQLLVDVLHRLPWAESPAWQALQTFLAARLPALHTSHPTLRAWQAHPNWVFLPQAPQAVAAAYLQSQQPWDVWKAPLRLPQPSTLSQAVARVVLQQPADEPAPWADLLGRLLPDFDRLLGDPDARAVYGRLLGYALSQPPPPGPRQALIHRVVQHPALGDPRLFPLRWASLPEAVRAGFARWLSRADLSMFFDRLLGDDPEREGRKQFWEPYLHQCPQFVGSWLVLGAEDERRLRRSGLLAAPEDNFGAPDDDASAEAPPLPLARLRQGARQSAFILEFTRYVVVEFSGQAATYIYEKQAYLQKLGLGSLYEKPVFLLSDLRDATWAIDRLVHRGDWQTLYAARLERLGILCPAV